MNTGSEPVQNADSAPDQPAGHELSSVLPPADQSAQSADQSQHGSERRPAQPSAAAEALQPTPGSNVVRIYGISDCVLAVAFTLFVENIRLPPAGLSADQLRTFVTNDMLPDIAYYFGAYLVVASSWISHYRVISYLRQSNSLFILLNVVFLGTIVFLPVPIALFYQHANQTGVWQLFSGTQALTSLTLLLLWVVARADHLLDEHMPAEYLRYTTARLIIISFGTLLSFTLAFWSVAAAIGVFLSLFVLAWLLHGFMQHFDRRLGYLPGTTRMCSITDNMTAVAVTFLIAPITAAVAGGVHQGFSQTLSAIGNALPAYGITFLIVGIYWLSHHRVFLYIRQHNMTLIWLNFAFLLCVELQPPFNALHSTYPHSQLTSFLYAGNQALCGVMILVIWIYAAQGHRLISPAMDQADAVTIAWSAFVAPLLFLLSMAVVIFRNDYAVPLWLVVIGAELALIIYGRLRHAPNQVGRAHSRP
jgi:uncharacterized membrane protein